MLRKSLKSHHMRFWRLAGAMQTGRASGFCAKVAGCDVKEQVSGL
jgi:hypothetical protein